MQSKNNSRRITLGIGPIWGITSLTSLSSLSRTQPHRPGNPGVLGTMLIKIVRYIPWDLSDNVFSRENSIMVKWDPDISKLQMKGKLDREIERRFLVFD